MGLHPIRHAVVTGASSGIGRAIARSLATGGAAVVAIGRDQERLAGLVAESPPDRARFLVLDLADPEATERGGRLLVEDLPELDLLVHAAGVHARAPVADGELAELHRVLAVNLSAPYQLTQRLLPSLIRARGQVAFINSTIVQRPAPEEVAYAASKAALRALADGLREEVGAQGVRVVSVLAGRTDTPMQEAILRHEGRAVDPDQLLAPADVADALLAALQRPSDEPLTEIEIRPARR